MTGLPSPPAPATPLAAVRRTLDQAERRLARLAGSGTAALQLLSLFDALQADLSALESAGVDVRAEQARFETLRRQLRHRAPLFLAEVGEEALRAARDRTQPAPEHRWWFLDEEEARQRRRRQRRTAARLLAVLLVAVVGYLLYRRFAAPPNVRQARQHEMRGESLVESGDLAAALSEFEAAAALAPDDPTYHLWRGVLLMELGEPSAARSAFDAARPLYEQEEDFLLERGLTYLRAGDAEAASADAERVIALAPRSGWGYYLRGIAAAQVEDYPAALSDLERAATLAQQAGDRTLEALARTRRAALIQMTEGGNLGLGE